MQFESIIHSKAPRDGKPAEPAYMVFRPDAGFYFQILTTGKRHTASLQPLNADCAHIPINGEDVQPLLESKKSREDDELLRIIRKYVQTKGLGLRASSDSLHGTVHTVPEESVLFNGKVRHSLGQDEFNELPLPKLRET
jgi:hypothetical protein